jgi:hypothetical protein
MHGREVVGGELGLGVDDLGLDRPGGERLLLDVLGIDAAGVLTDVDREGDDLDAVVVDHPADGDGGVEAARVGEDDALGHGGLLQVRER